MIVLLLSVCLAFNSPVQSESSVEASSENIPAVLKEMSESLRNLNYQGRFVYLVDGDMSSFQIQHAVIDGLEYERLVFLNEEQQEIVRVGHDLFCIHPGNNVLKEYATINSNPFSGKTLNLFSNFSDSYDVSIQNGKPVAGQETYQISFKSKSDNLYDHALWVDRQSKLLLKIAVSDAQLGVLESFEYVQITIGEKINKSEFEHENFAHHKAVHLSSASADEKQSEESAWKVSWLPDGFYSSGVAKKYLKEQNKTIDMLMYTDGIVSISVFVDKVERGSRFNESSQLGALSTYSHGIKGSNGNHYMITVVGNVHLKAAERIAKSVSDN